MMDIPTLGGQELEAFRFVSEQGPVSVGEMAKEFGHRHGLARTTVSTMLDRLRAKGYLDRRMVDGMYRYVVRIERDALLTSLVSDFVERSLGGSLAPFVAYLADTGKLTDREIASLRSMVDSLESDDAGVK